MAKRLNAETLDSKQFKKASKTSGEKYVKEFLQKSDEEMKQFIAHNRVENHKTDAEMKVNPAYASAKDKVSMFEKAKREALQPGNDLEALALFELRLRKQEKTGASSVAEKIIGAKEEIEKDIADAMGPGAKVEIKVN